MVFKKLKRKRIFYILSLVLVVVISIFLVTRGTETSIVRGDVVDARSREPVYGARVATADKVTFVFFDSSFELTGIPSGNHALEVDALGYAPYRKQVQISQRTHEYEIALEGTHIPGLVRVYAFTESGPRGIDVEVRFANADNLSILYYPLLEISLKARIYVEENVPQVIYDGPLKVTWQQERDPWKYWGHLSWDELDKNRLDEKYGIMELEVFIPNQGSYRTSIPGVKLFW